ADSHGRPFGSGRGRRPVQLTYLPATRSITYTVESISPSYADFSCGTMVPRSASEQSPPLTFSICSGVRIPGGIFGTSLICVPFALLGLVLHAVSQRVDHRGARLRRESRDR